MKFIKFNYFHLSECYTTSGFQRLCDETGGVYRLESKFGLDEPVVSSRRNTRYRVSQAFSHPVGCLAFADKRIRSGR